MVRKLGLVRAVTTAIRKVGAAVHLARILAHLDASRLPAAVKCCRQGPCSHTALHSVTR